MADLAHHDALEELVIARKEAFYQGETPSTIRTRVARRYWERLTPGLYLATPPGVERSEEAAWWLELRSLAHRFGDNGAISGAAAARLLGVEEDPWADADPFPIEAVTALSSHLRDRRVRRSRLFDRASVVMVQGLPVTGVVDTLLRLASVYDAERLALAVEAGLRGENPRRPDEWHEERLGELRRKTAEHRNLPGHRRMRLLLDDRGEVLPTGSAAETKLDLALRRVDVRLTRQFRVQLRAGRTTRTYWIDLCDPVSRVAAEVDGRIAHGASVQVERDYWRDNLLSEVLTVVRFAAGRIASHAPSVAKELVERTRRARPTVPAGWTVREVPGGIDVVAPVTVLGRFQRPVRRAG